MKKIIIELDDIFSNISKMGWIKSLRNGSTGIGYTFETLIGKKEDFATAPDYNGIEIKTHRTNSRSYISLFNYNPVGETSYELRRIFDEYSFISPANKQFKIINASLYCNYISKIGLNYNFSLSIDFIEKKMFLVVFDRFGQFIEKKSYWTFDVLKEKLYKKLKYLAYIEADSKFLYGHEYFRYRSISFYKLKDFNTFIKLLHKGKIKVSFLLSNHVGLPSSSMNSHGVSFCIKKENLHLLYDPIK